MIGVYIARNKEGQALYVGSSGCISKRLSVHRAKAAWWSKVEDIETIPTDSRFLAFELERQKILELSPLHNIMSKDGNKRQTKVRGPVVVPRTVVLARVIEEHGTVANLAKACGVDHQTMSNVWRGVYFPSSKVIARLMVITGLGFDDLFEVDVLDGATSPTEWREFRGARSLPKPKAVA